LPKNNLTEKGENRLFLATGNGGRTVFHVAAKRYKVDVFEEILNWAK
jgi:hypothetical protein